MKTPRPTSAIVVTLVCWLVASVASAQTVFHVDDDAPPGGDGATWNTAFRYLQDALSTATDGDEIRMAGGVYKPDQDESGTIAPGDRAATFQLGSDLGLFGGYRGCPGGNCASGDPNERSIELYETRLSGDLSGDDVADLQGFVGCFSGDGTPHAPGCEVFDLDADGDVDIADGHVGENTYHLVTGSGTDATAVLDGLTITGGNADGPSQEFHVSGGGMYNDAGSPTLIGVRFVANLADTRGGGMYNIAASPTLTDCAFIANRAVRASGAGGGGAMRNDEGSSPILSGCSFLGNRSPSWGGAISDQANCDPTLTGCTFVGNSGGAGGAISINGGVPTYVNCTFTDNFSPGLGGAMDVFWGDPTLTNCRFEGNVATVHGGAISTDNTVALTVSNSTFIGNSCAVSDGGALFLLGGTPTITNCRFFGNSAGRFGGGVLGAAVQVSITNCVFSGNSAFKGGGYMGSNSVAQTLTNCTFTENTASDTIGGVYIIGAGDQTLANCILWNNSDTGGTGESAQIFLEGAGLLVVRHSLIQGLDTLTGNGNIDGDPLFRDASGADNTIGTEDDDLRVGSGSPCIDAADNTAVPSDAVDLDGDGNAAERTPLDLGGNPRFNDDPETADTGVADPPDYLQIADMGAYEFSGAGVAVPTVSAWGMVVMMLLLLASATVVLSRQRQHLSD